MVIIQRHPVIKAFYQYFIKRLFNLFILKFVILIFIALFLTSKFTFGEKSMLDEVYCNSKNFPILLNKKESASYLDKNFDKILKKIDENLLNKKYNLIVSLGSRPSGGYKLEFEKIKIKNKKTYIYFKEIKPPQNSKNIAVITYPFCLVKIENLQEHEVRIKGKRSELFPFSVFN